MTGSIAPIIINKLLTLFLLMFLGGAVRKMGIIDNNGEKYLSVLLVDIFWPALIFTSITGTLTRSDILENLMLPILAMVTILTGAAIGYAAAGLTGYRDARRRSFLFQSMMNNFVFMVLPFALLFLPKRGAGLLFVHNLGIILLLWTFCVPVLRGDHKQSLGQSLKTLAGNPTIIVTLIAIFLVLTGLNRSLPGFVVNSIELTGSSTVAIAMIVAGSRIAGEGIKALRLDVWNLLIALIRLILVPGVLLGLSLLLWQTGRFKPETLTIFMLVNIVPVGVFSVSLANRYNTAPELMAQSVALTHIIGAGTMFVWIILLRQMPFFV